MDPSVLSRAFKMKLSISVSFMAHLLLIGIMLVPIHFLNKAPGNTQEIQVHFDATPFVFHRKEKKIQPPNYQGDLYKKKATRLNSKMISGKQRKLLLYLHDQIQLVLNQIVATSTPSFIQVAFSILTNGKLYNTQVLQSNAHKSINQQIISTLNQKITIPKGLIPNQALSFRINVRL